MAAGRDRRAFTRIEILAELHGQLAPFGTPVTLQDISAGGFSIESDVPFPAGARHTFRFTTAHDDEFVIEAVVVYCRANPAETVASYITGFAFVPESTSDWIQKVRPLLDALG